MHSPIASITSAAISLGQFASNIAMDLRDGFRCRFDYFYSPYTGVPRGLFIHLPFTSRSLWAEWREQSVGFGINRTDPENVEFFAGRIQGVLSVEDGR